MTTQPEIPRGGNDPDTGDRPVPPYDDRRTSADVDPQEKSQREGAKVGGATGPVEDDELKATPKQDTPRGAGASPSDEQPASESTDSDLDPDLVGPDHYEGTPRGEDEGA